MQALGCDVLFGYTFGRMYSNLGAQENLVLSQQAEVIVNSLSCLLQ